MGLCLFKAVRGEVLEAKEGIEEQLSLLCAYSSKVLTRNLLVIWSPCAQFVFHLCNSLQRLQFSLTFQRNA